MQLSFRQIVRFLGQLIDAAIYIAVVLMIVGCLVMAAMSAAGWRP